MSDTSAKFGISVVTLIPNPLKLYSSRLFKWERHWYDSRLFQPSDSFGLEMMATSVSVWLQILCDVNFIMFSYVIQKYST